MPNLYKSLIALLPSDETMIGEVIAQYTSSAAIELLGGAQVLVKAEGLTPGDKVYVRSGEVVGTAPNLTTYDEVI